MPTLVAVLAALGGLGALIAVVIFMLKVGTIAHLWSKPEPQDESAGHTLSQSREAGRASASRD